MLLGENKSKDGVAQSVLRNGTKRPQELLLPMKSLRATSPCWLNPMRFDYALVQNIHDPATVFLFSTPGVNCLSLVTMKLHYYKLCLHRYLGKGVDARCYRSAIRKVSNITTLLVIPSNGYEYDRDQQQLREHDCIVVSLPGATSTHRLDLPIPPLNR